MPTVTGPKERLVSLMRQELLPNGCTFGAEQLLDSAEPLIKLAVHEDVPDPKLVDARLLIDRKLTGQAILSANAEGVLAGGWMMGLIAAHYSRSLEVEVFLRDGTRLNPGDQIAAIRGTVANIVTAERVFLNFISRLSGIATLTWRCARAINGTNAVVTDTRKTLPGYRVLDKYAVQCGGGKNHRMGLCDGVMIKDNHISAMGEENIPKMVRRVRNSLSRRNQQSPVWVEVDRIDQLPSALEGQPDVILLDNMSFKQMRTAVELRNEWFIRAGLDGDRPVPLLEASGGIDLSNIGDVARTGVDRIAVGAITHSAPALDLTVELITGSTKAILRDEQ